MLVLFLCHRNSCRHAGSLRYRGESGNEFSLWSYGAGFEAIRSVMNYPYGESKWDFHSTAVINSNANVVPATGDINAESWPKSIRLRVRDKLSEDPLEGVGIELYKVDWYTFKISKVDLVL